MTSWALPTNTTLSTNKHHFLSGRYGPWTMAALAYTCSLREIVCFGGRHKHVNIISCHGQNFNSRYGIAYVSNVYDVIITPYHLKKSLDHIFFMTPLFGATKIPSKMCSWHQVMDPPKLPVNGPWIYTVLWSISLYLIHCKTFIIYGDVCIYNI